MGLALLALVCVGAADSTWGGIFTDFVEASIPHWPWVAEGVL